MPHQYEEKPRMRKRNRVVEKKEKQHVVLKETLSISLDILCEYTMR